MNMNKLRSRKVLWAAGIALGAVLSGGAVSSRLTDHSAQATEAAAPAPQALPVSVAVVESREMVPWQEFSGRLEAVEKVEVRSRVAGQVLAVHFREGGMVKKGDLLVTIDPAPFAAEVARAEAQLAQTQARVAFTKREYDRAQALTGSGNMPMRELDSRTNAYFEAQANVRAAQAELDAARLNLGYTQIRAPVGGRVGKAEITVGNLVPAGAGAPVLTSLMSVAPIYASFNADEQVVVRALDAVHAGGAQVESIPVRMNVGGRDVDGHVQMIGNSVDAKSGTVQVRAVFGNEDGRLIPGQFARLQLGRAQPEQALLISERAVGTDQDKKFVMVVGDDNRAIYREVTLGASAGTLRVVTTGLKAGERIVVNGLQRVRPGVLLAPTQISMAPAGTELAAR